MVIKGLTSSCLRPPVFRCLSPISSDVLQSFFSFLTSKTQFPHLQNAYNNCFGELFWGSFEIMMSLCTWYTAWYIIRVQQLPIFLFLLLFRTVHLMVSELSCRFWFHTLIFIHLFIYFLRCWESNPDCQVNSQLLSYIPNSNFDLFISKNWFPL
jgi:hypothetical protein